MLWVALPLGGLATALGIMAALAGGRPTVVALDVAFYLLLISAAVARRIPRIIRVSVAIAAVFVLSAVLLLSVGPESAALLLLLVPVFTTAVLISARSTIIVGGATVGLLAVVTVLLLLGRLSWTLEPWTWATHVGSFVAIGSLMTSGSLFLIRKIGGTLEKERKHASERAKLLSEIQHRVKNNLQVMVSLLRIQASSAEKPEVAEALHRAEARVLAMFLAYEQIYRQSDEGSIELSALLQKTVQESVRLKYGRFGKGTVSAQTWDVGPDRAVSVALLVEELLVGYPASTDTKEPLEFEVTAQEQNGEMQIAVAYPGIWSDAERQQAPEYQIVLALIDQAQVELSWEERGGRTECRALLHP